MAAFFEDILIHASLGNISGILSITSIVSGIVSGILSGFFSGIISGIISSISGIISVIIAPSPLSRKTPENSTRYTLIGLIVLIEGVCFNLTCVIR